MQWLVYTIAMCGSFTLLLAVDSPAAVNPARASRGFGMSGNGLGGADLEDLENWRALYAKRAAMMKRGFDGYGSNNLGNGDMSEGNLQDWSSLFERGLRGFGKQGGMLGSDGLRDEGLQNWMNFYNRHARNMHKRNA